MQALIVYITPGFENVEATAALKELLTEIAQSGGIKIHLILSGETLDLLAESAPELVRQYSLLLTSGKISPAGTFSYDSIPGDLSSERLIRSAFLRRGWFERAKIPPPNVFFSPLPLDAEVLRGLAGLGYDTFVVRDPLNRSVTPLLVGSDGSISVIDDGLEPPIRVTVIDRAFLNTLTFPTFKELVHGLDNLRTVDQVLGGEVALQLEPDEIESMLAPIAAEPAESRPAEPPVIRRFLARRALIENEFRPIPNLVQNSAHFTANTEHQRLAELYLLRLRTPETANEYQFLDPRFRHYLYRSIIQAQVEIDSVSRPETDPTAGWVDITVDDFDGDGIQEIQIDSQLQRIFLRDVSFIGWEYKPRKGDFLNLITAPHPLEPAAIESVVPSESSLMEFYQTAGGAGGLTRVEILEAALDKPKLIRHAPDLVTIRLKRQLKLKLADGSLFSTAIVKDLSVRAGVGAHLNNATTGFSIEYWLETNDDIDDSLVLVDEWNTALPSADAEGWSGRLLHGGGGTSQHPFPLIEPLTADGYSTPGGLHGIRLIDGIGPLVIDLRSAKPLSEAEVTPLITTIRSLSGPAAGTDQQVVQGINVRMAISAKRIADDYHTNTLFVSIL